MSYLHLMICSDPFQNLGHFYGDSFSDFVAVMQAEPLPFDNFYTSQDGFVARQTRSNERYRRLFTWEFSKRCNSFVTLPIAALRVPVSFLNGSMTDLGDWTDYTHGKAFAVFLSDSDLSGTRVLNLNLLISLIAGVLARHRTLAGFAGVKGPFYIKTKIENVWRTVPFVDTEEYMAHVAAFDIPVVQDSDLIAPSGRWPEGFIPAPELDHVPSEDQHTLNDTAFTVWVAVMQALGIPGQVLIDKPGNMLAAANREATLHRERSAK